MVESRTERVKNRLSPVFHLSLMIIVLANSNMSFSLSFDVFMISAIPKIIAVLVSIIVP